MLKMTMVRKEKGWSQHELARRANMYNTDICKIEGGWLKPFPAQAKRLGKVLELSIDELIQPIDPPGDMVRKMDEMTKEITGDNR